MSDLELEDNYFDLFEQIEVPKPRHQLFGHPYLHQNDDMDIISQLVSNGFDAGRGFDDTDQKIVELRQGAKDWMFLLQLDSDRNAGMHWGISEGVLYFWIKKAHLKQHIFEEAHLVRQFI